ncbi:hypothetical protein HYT56_02860 [Candidatus Woesearchaeota archaeon]|nr:hypothetical protein [Candidatus Woesearchaeota archaeon]
MNQKILVGCPTSDYHEYALKEYAEAVKNLTYKNYDILLVDNSKDDSYLKKLKSFGLPAINGPWYESAKKRIITSRDILREEAIQGNYNFLLSLEQDVIPPKDIIENLLKHKQDIVSALYFMPNNTSLIPMLAIKEKNQYGYVPFNYADKNNNTIKVNYAGLGCILISRRVLEKIEFRIDEKPGFDDWFFCKDAEKEGFKIFADLSIKCKHLIKNRPWDWSQLKL